MVLIRNYLITALLLLSLAAKSQTVYYPAAASQLLKFTAEDLAMLLQKAVAGSKFTTLPYTVRPASGIVLVYDEAVNFNNQACRVKGNGTNLLSFSASQDNGLSFGIYEFLHQLGFRFYQPGSVWESIPSLSSAFPVADTTYSCRYKYKNWFITGGARLWIMDSNNSYPWDSYSGENGHAWVLYQRRNNMTGGYSFRGHRADIMTGSYLEALKNNACFVAPYDGSRQVSTQSVPDVNSTEAMKLWSDAISKNYAVAKAGIYSDTIRFANSYRNFKYGNEYIGIEVPDGARWANSLDDAGCPGKPFIKASDQQFTLSNFTARSINSIYTDKRFQLYAYGSHADVPSSSIGIYKNIDVQVIAGVYQNETSAKGLLNRWYTATPAVSEYQYLNMDQWSGGTPYMHLKDLQTTLKRLKEKNSQGIVWETSPSKFGTLPFLFAANRQLLSDVELNTSLQEFCDNLFGKSASTVYKLLQMWGDAKTVTVAGGPRSNKYKMPLYYKMLSEAVTQSRQDGPLVQQRLNELKVYLHYMQLYYSWSFDQLPDEAKNSQAAALCIYLAKINRLQIVNSYSLINVIISKYKATDNMYKMYNVVNGTAYLQGALPLITDAEINQDFNNDYTRQQQVIDEYKLDEAVEIKEAFAKNNLVPLDKIELTLNYTFGKDFASRAEFCFIAEKAGEVEVQYDPEFQMPNAGQVNFTAEATDKPLGIIKDYTISNDKKGAGSVKIAVPAAGTYKFTVTSAFKVTVKLAIKTNGNYFFKDGPFLGSTIEDHHNSLLSLPGFFYVPGGIKKVYFNFMNAKTNSGFATADMIGRAFQFKNPEGNAADPVLADNSDSALFYLPVPPGFDARFWQATKTAPFKLCFANISNLLWYATKKQCTDPTFTADVITVGGECITRLSGGSDAHSFKWIVKDANSSYEYSGNIINLPSSMSPAAEVTLVADGKCTVSKKLSDVPGYLAAKAACAAGALILPSKVGIVIYPNPGTGTYKCLLNNQPVVASSIDIYSSYGTRTASFSNSQQFSINNLPAALYHYRITVGADVYTGKLVKM